MADLNLKATEFIPSWLKKPAAAAASAAVPASSSVPQASQPQQSQHTQRKPVTTTTTPVPSTSNGQPQRQPPLAVPRQQQPPQQLLSPQHAPTQIPWKAPSNNHPPAVPTAPPATKSHMNPNATTFEPRFLTQPVVPQQQQQHPAQQSHPQQRPPLSAAAVVPQWPAPKRQSPQISSAPLTSAGAHLVLPPSNQPIVRAPSAAPVAAIQIGKSDAEVLAISKASSLKLNAAVFVPGQRSQTAKNLMLGKPSPLTLTPANPDTDMLLFDTWSLYCLCNSVTKEENFDPTPVFRIDSVPTFWKTMNNLPEPTHFSPPTTMYLFRDDIYPKWEDPKNRDGGLWKVRIPSDKVDTVWLILLCKTIGESWQKEYRNTINGVVLKAREKGFYIEIWVTCKMVDFPTELQNALDSQLPYFTIDHYSHQEIQEAVKKELANSKKSKKGTKRK